MKDDVKIPPPEKGGFDVEVFSRNLARMIEEGGKALSAYMKPREEGRTQTDAAENIAEIVGTLGQVAQFWLSDPDRTMALQADLGRSYLELWANAAQRMTGEFPPA